MPVLVAPSASNMLAHRDGELAVARAASSAGVLSTLSTFASKSVEECARAQHVGQLLQIYIFKV